MTSSRSPTYESPEAKKNKIRSFILKGILIFKKQAVILMQVVGEKPILWEMFPESGREQIFN